MTSNDTHICELEHPFVKVPYECINKSFRQSQKSIEKEMVTLDKAMKKIRQTKQIPKDKLNKNLDVVVQKLLGVKRKLDEIGTIQDENFRVCRKRIDHLKHAPVYSSRGTVKQEYEFLYGKNNEEESMEEKKEDEKKEDVMDDNSIEKEETTKDEDDDEEMKDVEEAKPASNSNEKEDPSVSPKDSDYVIENTRKWNQTRVNRVLADYLLRKGYFESANEMARKLNMEDFVDMSIFEQSKQVIQGLKKKKCKDAIKWCSSHKSKLKKLKSTFEFNLRLQEFIELAREEKHMKAIMYAREHLASVLLDDESELISSLTEDQQDDMRAKVREAMAITAFGKATKVEKYQKMFDNNRWNDLIEQFQRDNYLLHSLTTQPLLYINLQSGLSALKTPIVFDEENYNVNDPLCHEPFQKLSDHLPFACHHNSKLVCRITGKTMDDRNPPMVLPNGNVYSLEAMKEMSESGKDKKIKDPRSGDVYHFSELKKGLII